MILPFVVAGLVLGSLYALSGVGMLVLYRTTGVLNFGYGALGAVSAMLAWQFVELRMQPVLAYALGIIVATALSLLFGFLAGPFLATVDHPHQGDSHARARPHPARRHAVRLERQGAHAPPVDRHDGLLIWGRASPSPRSSVSRSPPSS